MRAEREIKQPLEPEGRMPSRWGTRSRSPRFHGTRGVEPNYLAGVTNPYVRDLATLVFSEAMLTHPRAVQTHELRAWIGGDSEIAAAIRELDASPAELEAEAENFFSSDDGGLVGRYVEFLYTFAFRKLAPPRPSVDPKSHPENHSAR